MSNEQKPESPQDGKTESTQDGKLESLQGKLLTKQPETINQQPVTSNLQQETQPQTEDMEVHHHAHHAHEKKTWKNYFWEFFMLFLAVFSGSLAELQLEHYIEHKREKQYIAAMVKELKADSAQLANVFRDTIRVKRIDSLSILLLSRSNSQETIKQVYRLAGATTSYNAMVFNRNTLTQLKSSGNMRLIRNPDVVDSLNKLDNIITVINQQMDSYKNITIDNIRDMYSILDYSYFVKNGVRLKKIEVLDSITVTYLTTDKNKVIEFGAKVGFAGSGLNSYFKMLREYATNANGLISYLQKEYHLEHE